MPDASVLEAMYGAQARREASSNPEFVICGDEARTKKALDGLPRGVLLDYGCGGGGLLAVGKGMGFDVVGVEWDADQARAVSTRLGVRVFTPDDPELEGVRADILHLGDVIEHMTDLNAQFPHALQLLKPTGTLICQGPLQANTTLFNLALRIARPLIRRIRKTEVAPEHVILATLRGQLALFRRFTLEQRALEVWEINWPAPEQLTVSVAFNPRQLALYALAEFSRAISRRGPGRWGNRYFYVGRPSVSAAVRRASAS
jgi:SAM-dependent methyltransferase